MSQSELSSLRQFMKDLAWLLTQHGGEEEEVDASTDMLLLQSLGMGALWWFRLARRLWPRGVLGVDREEEWEL